MCVSVRCVWVLTCQLHGELFRVASAHGAHAGHVGGAEHGRHLGHLGERRDGGRGRGGRLR